MTDVLDDQMQNLELTIDEQRQKCDQLRAELEAQEFKLRKLIEARDALSLAARPEVSSAQYYVSQKLSPKRGIASYRKLLEQIEKEKDGELVARQVEEKLSELGYHTPSKYVANTLNRLSKIGALRKIGRGRYLHPEYGFSIEGLMGEDD